MSLKIAADRKWVDTGIDLVAGRTYRLEARGEWADQLKSCGPEGYCSRDYPRPIVALVLWAAVPFRRMPTARWLALVGSTDQRHHFRIGAGRTLLARRSGRLWCFANDMGSRYGNNKGSVDLVVREVEPGRTQPH